MAGLLMLAACNASRSSTVPDGGPYCTSTNRFQHGANRKLDLLLVIDNSPGMAPLQAKLAEQLPRFVDALDTMSGGRQGLDLHLAFITSSMGAGAFPNVPGCAPGGPGDGGGRFVHPAACTALAREHSFIITAQGQTNFSGGLRDLFACMADVGSDGCLFSQPLAATRRALQKAADPRDLDNGGFLRPDSLLMVVVVTNQDDCSVPAGSELFDPAQTSASDPLGALAPYRCAEFGHTCGGQTPPHELPAGVETLALAGCTARMTGAG